MRILLTNDDGIDARGLRALRDALEVLGEVWVVAPEREHSAASHALTLHKPLRIKQLDERVFSVSGTPTDCVLLAVRGVPGLMEPRPEVVVSGINHGPNMGDDVTYSGTVAAAIEGRLLGIPSVAFSNAAWKPRHLDASAAVARELLSMLSRNGIPDRTLLNVNLPDLPLERIRAVRITKLGKRVYRDEIVSKVDPRGRPYYWIGGEPPIWEHDEASDFTAVSEGFVSVTPLQLDWTAYGALERLKHWEREFRAPDSHLGGKKGE